VRAVRSADVHDGSVNILSLKTIGHLVAAAKTSSGSNIRDLLMQSGLLDLAGGYSADIVLRSGPQADNKQELLRKPLMRAQELASDGDKDANNAILAFIVLWTQQLPSIGNGHDALPGLRDALHGDGYQLTVEHVPGGRREPRILPLDPDPAPLSAEITALEAELGVRGYSEATHHYRRAIKLFADQDYEPSNGQLRDMYESLVLELASQFAGYVGNGRAGQGSPAIAALTAIGGQPPAVVGQPLPEYDGGRLIRGIWDVLHPRGPHPGISNAIESRIRMQLVTAGARLLLQQFPDSSTSSLRP
jgi:hypothetical protein